MVKRAELVESRQKKRRKQIFNGAVKVFAEKGFHNATTQEIADASGLAKGTLYEYVKDKEGILVLTMEEAINMVSKEIEKGLYGVNDPLERLRRTILVHLKFAKKYRNAAKVMQRQMGSLSADGKKRISVLMEGQMKNLKSILDQGIESGRFKPVNTQIAAELFMHACTFYFDYGDLEYQKASLNEITEYILDNFIQSIINKN